MKLSLAMIAKDELENLTELHVLIADHVDEWVVVVPPKDKAIPFLESVGAKVVIKDFTQPIEPKLITQFGDYGLDVDKDYRLFRFADARNESFAQATGDYILWLDADDRPRNMAGLKELIASKAKADVFDVVYDYAKDTEGNSTSDHVRERIIKNKGQFEWKGAALGLIHETLVPKNGVAPLSYAIPKKDFYVEHTSDHQEKSSTRNFIALLYEYIKTNAKDARTTYYLGIEFFNRGMYEYCIKIMQEYVRVGGWDEERYRAWVRMAEAYHQLGDKESSRNAYLNATKEMPNYPDAYLGLGESYYSSQEWVKAVEFIMTGLQKPVPNTKAAIDMTKYTFRSMTFMSLSFMKLGKQREAVEWFLKAKKFNPTHPWVKEYEELFADIQDLDTYVRSFVKLGQIAQRRYPRTLSKLAESIPEELKDQELLLAFKRKYTTPKVWPDNSVVFWCSQAFEEWGPDSLTTGTGGSEEAIIQLTKRLAKLGWDVTVFNNCPKEQTKDGVKWVRFERFNPRDVFNALVSWRSNCFLEPRVARKKLIDVHDVPSVGLYPERALKDVTLVVKSDYHRKLFAHLPDSQFAVIPNGVDLSQFTESKKTKNNLVWTSSYDRGLEYLLNMWADIRKAVPDATLDVYYGFELYDESERGMTDAGKHWKQMMLGLLEQDGVTHHGRVGTEEIAKAYLKADVWAYPTDFPEIDCITATKAMAAKCVPIATDHAVMAERNQGVVIHGSGKDPKVQSRFKKELIALLQDEERKQSIRDELIVAGYDWDDIAKRWDEELKRE